MLAHLAEILLVTKFIFAIFRKVLIIVAFCASLCYNILHETHFLSWLFVFVAETLYHIRACVSIFI